MEKKNYSYTSELTSALELLRLGKVNAARQMLGEHSVSDLALSTLERGDISGAFDILRDGQEMKFKISSLLISEDRLDEPTRQLKQNLFNQNSSKGGLGFKPNSPAIMPFDQYKSILSSNAVHLISTQVRPDLMQFKSKVPVVNQIGVTIDYLPDGNKISIPTETTEIPAVDIVEGISPDDPTDPEWQSYSVTEPKTVNSTIHTSRTFHLMLGDLGNEMLKNRLNDAIMKRIDERTFYGTGTNGQATGIFYNEDVPSIDGHSFTRDTALQMIKTVSNAEAPEDRMFVLGTGTEEVLSKRALADGSDHFIIENGLLLGKPYLAHKRITDGHVFYGHFGTVYLPLWIRAIRFNPFIGEHMNIRIDQWQEYDILIRQPTWLIVAEDVD